MNRVIFDSIQGTESTDPMTIPNGAIIVGDVMYECTPRTINGNFPATMPYDDALTDLVLASASRLNGSNVLNALTPMARRFPNDIRTVRHGDNIAIIYGVRAHVQRQNGPYRMTLVETVPRGMVRIT